MLKNKLHQTGDTIVEVMVSLAIISMVLGASYAVANRSLRGVQTSQERTEASQIAQTMIETVKQYATKDDMSVFPAISSDVCFSSELTDISPAPPGTRVAPVAFNPAHPFCNQGFYRRHVVITPIAVPLGQPPEYEYAAIVEWSSLTGLTSSNQAVIRYKFVRVLP